MLKQKVYDWKDTNLALIGSDLDKDARLDSAETERAWDGCGEETSGTLKIWRIEKFKVKPWPKSQYGQFHEGDSYIIYHSYKLDGQDKLFFDIFFWIGSSSSQDEYGTAAYKTVELDAKLRDAAVQHREIQFKETKAFKELFGGHVEYLPGGVETGFNHWEPENHDPELFRVKGVKDSIEFKKVKLRKDSLNSGDVFILDIWDRIFQWNGKNSNPSEKGKATSYLDSVVLARGKDTKKEVFEEGQENPDFWTYIPDHFGVACITLQQYNVQANTEEKDDEVIAFKKTLYKLYEPVGATTLKFNKVKAADLKKGNKVSKLYLNTNDVFVLDDGFIIWVWVGKAASPRERGGGMNYAMKYIKSHSRPVYMPIRQVHEGAEPLVFLEQFNNDPIDSSCVIV